MESRLSFTIYLEGKLRQEEQKTIGPFSTYAGGGRRLLAECGAVRERVVTHTHDWPFGTKRKNTD